jgi:hypothetical protein
MSLSRADEPTATPFRDTSRNEVDGRSRVSDILREVPIADGRYLIAVTPGSSEVVLGIKFVSSDGEVTDAGTVELPRLHLPLIRAAIHEALRRAEHAPAPKAYTLADLRAVNPSSHLPWTDAEEATLLVEHDAGRSITEIATLHQRTDGAIRSRLIKLGREVDTATTGGSS